MHSRTRRTPYRTLTASLALAAAGILIPASAMAQSGPIASIAPWQECLQGQQPTSQNVAPGAMDTEPNFDEVILDFDDDLSHNQVLTWAHSQGLHVELNSPASDAPNVYIARVAEGAPHRTLGAMQDQDQTDEAVSCAHSFDHVASNASPTLAPRPTSSIVSLELSLPSSVMDTVSQAAAKDITRAPPPPKASRLPRFKKVRSEPSSPPKPKAGNAAKTKRAVPAVERIGPDPREGA